MGVPDYQTLMRPTLVALTAGQPMTRGEIRARIAHDLALTDDDLTALLPSGQPLFASRSGWALTYLAQAGLVARVARGSYAITDAGRAALVDHPHRIDNDVLADSPEFVAFRRRHKESAGDPTPKRASEASDEPLPRLSPTETIEAMVAEADEEVAAELLDRVLALPPAFLERLSLRLLQAMGYGGRERLAVHTGKPGDAGLDGIIRQDALGLDLVGVQAKRYDRATAVQRPEIQAFVGALQGAQTNRGVFVTTGRFSSGARQFADDVAMRLVLIDGAELTRLMVRYRVGVSVRETYELTSVDEDFFDAEG